MRESLVPVLSGVTRFFPRCPITNELSEITTSLILGFLAGAMTTFLICLFKIYRQEDKIRRLKAELFEMPVIGRKSGDK